jgi:hypothetical protein
MRKLLLALALAAEPAGCYEMAHADTISIGFRDFNQVGPGGAITTIVVSGQPIVQLLPQTPGQPQFLGSGFGFDQIIAMVMPPGGNQFSGGLGGPSPTFEFAFSDGFVPPQGGTIQLFATWQGALTAGNVILLPSLFETNEMPAGHNGLIVGEQIFVCGFAVVYCTDGSKLSGQDVIQDTLRADKITLAAPAPGQPLFKGISRPLPEPRHEKDLEFD